MFQEIRTVNFSSTRLWIVAALTLVLSCSIVTHAFAETDVLREQIVEKVSISAARDVAILLQQGASPNTTNEYNQTLLAIAIDRNDAQTLPIVESLLLSGADPNKATNNDLLPLILAIRNEQPEVMRSLIEAGAHYRVKDDFGYSSFDIAETKADPQILAILKAEEQKEQEQAAYLRSLEYLEKEVKRFSYYSCINEYLINQLSFAYDNYTPEQRDKISSRIEEQRIAIDQIAGEILDVTGYEAEKMKEIAIEVRQRINDDLNEMITTAFRKKMGVGTNEDMENRCHKITDPIHPVMPKPGMKKQKGFYWE